VHSIGGKAGHILFGPYILLPAGGYQLFASVRSRSVNKTVKGLFALEVTYQGLFLARREIAEPFTSDAPLSLEFSLPPRIAALLSEGWFETRVWTNGLPIFRLTRSIFDDSREKRRDQRLSNCFR